MHSLLRAFFLGLLLLPVFPFPAEAAKTYKWVDENGVTQYTQYPPPDAEVEVIEPSIGTPSSARDTNGAGESSQEDAEGGGDDEPDTLAEFCQQLRDEAEVLKGDRRVSVRDEEGNLTPLEGEQREARMANLQQRIDQYCNN